MSPADSAAPAPLPQALPCGIVTFDDTSQILWASDALWQMLEEPVPAPGDPQPRSQMAQLLTPAARLVYQTGALPVLLTRLRVDESYLSLRTRLGQSVPVVANFTREPSAGGGPARNTAVFMLLRDRQQLDEELLRARRTSEQVPGLICQILWHGDERASLPFASDALHTLFDVRTAEAREDARLLLHRVLAADRPALRDSLRRSALEMRTWHHRFRVRVRGQVRWIEGRAMPQRLAAGHTLWHAYVVDITEHLALETQLAEQALAQRTAQAKEDFLAQVSHELRTPINAVLGFTRLLRSDPHLHLTLTQSSYLRHIETASRSLVALVNDVLELNRLEAGVEQLRREPCLLPPLIDECAQMMEPLARQAHLSLHPGCEPGLTALGDARRLKQCLVNLLGNAIKYNQPGGLVQLRAYSQGSQVGLAVSDTGPGLSEERRQHLFEAFNRLGAENGPQEGTGLGLIITRSLVQRMGGRIEVQSTLGQGSCFTLWLDRAPDPADGDSAPAADEPPTHPPLPPHPAPTAHALAPAAPAGDPQRHVLCVDDNPVNLMLLEAMLAMRPTLRLSLAEHPREALALAAQDPPDLLLIDLGLPELDGTELLQRLRELPPLAQVPAVAVSANAFQGEVQRALAAGFNAYWIKPLDLDPLLGAIDAWLQGHALPHLLHNLAPG